MKNVFRISAILLVLLFVFGICACDDITDSWRDEKKPDDNADSSKGYYLEGEAGCYYGTYTATDYNGEKSEGERNYFLFAYQGTYYLVRAKEPADEAAVYEKIGPDEYYKKKFVGTRLSVSPGEYDGFYNIATYTEKSRINDEQYLLTTYKISWGDHVGGMTFDWETKNVYKDREEPYETGYYSGKRKYGAY